MKRIIFIGSVVLLTVVLALALVACNGGNKGLTDPQLIKVKTAFDGVESSMNKDSAKNASVKTAAYSGLKMAAGMTEDAALTAIWNLYEEGDKQSNTSPELNYDEPPMRQFQYLKAIFDEMGDDFKLGTKYYYDISGTMYFDMATGYPVNTKTNEYLYNYVFGFALSIELNENDKIFAEVGFSIKLTKGTQEYNTSWYVSFDLTYDFNTNDPTYTLLMLTDNKEGELAFLNREQGYEYDYVEMKNGAIKEWRKFVMDTNRAIVIDAEHPSFETYADAGMILRADTAKWYKNNEYYKITRQTPEKERTLATAYADGLGLNTTSINAAAFLNAQGTINPVIDTYYKKICELYGGDVIYDLVCKKEDHYKENGNGGNDGGNNGQPSEANWTRATADTGIPVLVPAFITASATFSVEYDRESNAWLVRYSDIGENEIQNYCDALTAAGFIHETRSNYYFIDEENDQVILIAVTEIDGAIIIATTDLESAIVNVPYGLSFHGDVSGQNVTGINDVKSISDVDVLSQGAVTADELSALITGEGKSCIVDITVSYGENTDTTAEDYAQNKAKEYGALYMDDASWTKINNNTLCYKTQSSFDVIIIISYKVENGDPHIVLYVLLVPQGTAERIVTQDAGNNGQSGDGGNGQSGNGESGESGEGGQGQSGEPQEKRVVITVYYLAAKKEVDRIDYPEFLQEQVIDPNDVAMIERDPEENLYADADCTQPITKPFSAAERTVVYVWKEVAEQGTFVIYDVIPDGKPQLWQEFACETGDTDYYGYSFEYVVYYDESCTRAVPLDTRFSMTTDGITLYRKGATVEDYVVGTVDFYINDFLYDTRYTVYRRDKIVYAINGAVVDFGSYSYFGQNPVAYIGTKEEGTAFSYGDVIAFTAENTTLSAYVSNEDYRVYTISAGGEAVGQVVTNAPSSIVSYGNLFAKSTRVEGKTIVFENTSRWYTLTTKYAWNGKELCLAGELSYCTNDSPYEFIGTPSTSADNYFTDVNCRNPIVYDEEGIYRVTSTTTLYVPYVPQKR